MEGLRHADVAGAVCVFGAVAGDGGSGGFRPAALGIDGHVGAVWKGDVGGRGITREDGSGNSCQLEG